MIQTIITRQPKFKNDEWNEWTSKSEHVNFSSEHKSLGDGEMKLGTEFGVIPLGQNSSYDLNVTGEKWEIKKLDSDNSFRLGVEVSTPYTAVISTVIRILEKIDSIYNKLIDSDIKTNILKIINMLVSNSGRTKTLLLNGLKKNEVSEANLDKANEIIEILKSFETDIYKKVNLYDSYTGVLKEYDLTKAFEKLMIEDVSNTQISEILGGADVFNILLIKSELEKDLKLFKDNTLKEVLNNIVRSIFSHDVKLVLVHEIYGYKPITNLNSIYCNRITSGNPRCKII